MRRPPLVSRQELVAAMVPPLPAPGRDPLGLREAQAALAFANALAELPRGEYRVLLSITRIRRRKDGTEKSAELVREGVTDFKKSSRRRGA